MKLAIFINYLICLSVFSSDDIKLLLVDLDNESYEVREKAHQQIVQWLGKKGYTSIPLLKEQMKKDSSPEVIIRLEDIITSFRTRTMNMGSLELFYETHPNGVLIRQTVIGGAGQQAGLIEGDVIEKLDGIEIKKLGQNKENILHQFKSIMLQKFEKETVNLQIRRGEKVFKKEVKLGKRDLHLETKKENVELKKFEFK